MQLGVGISKRGYTYLGKGLNTLKVKGIGFHRGSTNIAASDLMQILEFHRAQVQI
jgi:hypothetical protein